MTPTGVRRVTRIVKLLPRAESVKVKAEVRSNCTPLVTPPRVPLVTVLEAKSIGKMRPGLTIAAGAEGEANYVVRAGFLECSRGDGVVTVRTSEEPVANKVGA